VITRDEAIAQAGAALAVGWELLDGGVSVNEAARMAYTPTGPPVEELERRIREHRAQLYPESA
jgi:hypothetical protein